LLYVISREKLAGLLDPLLQSGFVPDALFISCLDVPIFLESPDAKPSVNRFVYRNGPFLEAGLFEGKRLCYSRAFECPAGSPAEARRWIEETFRYASEKTGIEPSADMYRVRDALEKDADTPGEEPPGGVPVSLSLAQTVRDPFPGPLPPPLALETVSRLRERRRFRTRALRFLWIVFVLGSVLTARLAWTRNRLSQKLAQIETEIRTIQHEAGEAAVLKQKRDIFLEHVSRNERILKALVELYAAIPAHARLSLLEVDGTGTVVIKGVAERGAMDMVETLEASPVFREVSLRYQNRRSREKGVEFQIAAELEDARIAETLPRKEPAP
jgi:Tfp pilus assembly protein PilN